MLHFVYLWYDRSRKMFYIGSHSGSIDDEYTSSSRWLSGEIRYRPHHFKRRILSIHSTKDEAINKEYQLISLICEEEYGTRYYNIKPGRKKGCTAHNKGKSMPEKQKAKLSAAKTGKPSPMKGRKSSHSAQSGRKGATKLSQTITGRKMATNPDGTRYWIYPKSS